MCARKSSQPALAKPVASDGGPPDAGPAPVAPRLLSPDARPAARGASTGISLTRRDVEKLFGVERGRGRRS